MRQSALSNYPLLRSRDPEFVRERLLRVFDATEFDVTSGSGFSAEINHLPVGSLGLVYCDYAANVAIRVRESSVVRKFFSIEGSGRYDDGNKSGEICAAHWSPVLDARRPLKVEFEGRYRQLVLRIERDALSRNLRALLGRDIDDALEFDDTAEWKPAMEGFRQRIFQFAADYNRRGAYFSELVAAEVERMTIMLFLVGHRHNYTHLLLREPPSVAGSAVNTVEEYIEANWDKPLRIEALAAVAKVGVRSLFRQFKRDRGCSPADFAKQVRLDHAHEMLLRATDETSVTQVALRCGFHNAGHFSRDYRNRFGELPSATLRKFRY